MKFLLTLLLISCTTSVQKTPRQLFDDFHTYFEKGDFKAMDRLLADDFVGLDENDEISFTKKDYIAYMAEWNRAFETKWHVITITQDKGIIKSIEYDTDEFNDYFYGGKREVYYTYTFEKDKIKSIKAATTPQGKITENVFDERFKEFYQWVMDNHPDKTKYCNSYDYRSAMEVKGLLKLYKERFTKQG